MSPLEDVFDSGVDQDVGIECTCWIVSGIGTNPTLVRYREGDLRTRHLKIENIAITRWGIAGGFADHSAQVVVFGNDRKPVAGAEGHGAGQDKQLTFKEKILRVCLVILNASGRAVAIAKGLGVRSLFYQFFRTLIASIAVNI